MDIKIFPLFRRKPRLKKHRSFRDQWEETTLVEKTQIISTIATLATLVFIGIQVTDNHRLTKATERQVLIASQQNGAGFNPKVEATSIELIEPPRRPPFDLGISYKNIGNSRAERVTAVAYATIGEKTVTDSQTDDLLVQGEENYFEIVAGSLDWGSALSSNLRATVVVRVSYFGTGDNNAATPRTSCDEYVYDPRTENFKYTRACK